MAVAAFIERIRLDFCRGMGVARRSRLRHRSRDSKADPVASLVREDVKQPTNPFALRQMCQLAQPLARDAHPSARFVFGLLFGRRPDRGNVTGGDGYRAGVRA